MAAPCPAAIQDFGVIWSGPLSVLEASRRQFLQVHVPSKQMSINGKHLLKGVGTMFTQEYSATMQEGNGTRLRNDLINPLSKAWAGYIGALHVQMGSRSLRWVASLMATLMNKQWLRRFIIPVRIDCYICMEYHFPDADADVVFVATQARTSRAGDHCTCCTRPSVSTR